MSKEIKHLGYEITGSPCRCIDCVEWIRKQAAKTKDKILYKVQFRPNSSHEWALDSEWFDPKAAKERFRARSEQFHKCDWRMIGVKTKEIVYQRHDGKY